MKIIDWIRFRMDTLFRREHVYAEMEEELRSHIEHRADDLERSGIARAEAERRARIEFGGREKYKEEIHQAAGGNFIATTLKDVQFSIRVLRKAPGFTIAAVLTLALAIGANTVVFAVLNALILRPLNVPKAESLYTIEHGGYKDESFSYPDYLDLRDRNKSFDGLTAYILAPVGLDTGRNPTQVWSYEVTGNYFDAMMVQPYLGRFFHPRRRARSEQRSLHCAELCILAESLSRVIAAWLDASVQMNKHPYTILGVAPPTVSRHRVLYFSIQISGCRSSNTEQVAGAQSGLEARGMQNRGTWLVGRCEGGSNSRAGCFRSELYRCLPGEDISQARWASELFPGPAGASGQSCWAVPYAHSLPG
jgi:hypothetical protein